MWFWGPPLDQKVPTTKAGQGLAKLEVAPGWGQRDSSGQVNLELLIVIFTGTNGFDYCTETYDVLRHGSVFWFFFVCGVCLLFVAVGFARV